MYEHPFGLPRGSRFIAVEANIRPALELDVSAIVALVGANARKGGLLPRSEASIRAHLHNFAVAEALAQPALEGNADTGSFVPEARQIIGCGSLLPMSTTLVELRSLAVDENARGTGIGQRLVDWLVEAARDRKFGTIFALTRAVPFFQRCGFEIVPKELFPEKVWHDCVACPMLANCDEVAVMMTLEDDVPLSEEDIIQMARADAIDRAAGTTVPSASLRAISNSTTKRSNSRKRKAVNAGDLPNVNKVVLAYSGGLDTSVIVPWLRETYQCEVVCFTANIGQRENFEEIKRKALSSGASKHIVLDLRDEFANEYLLPLVQSGAIYEYKYFLGSAISRPLIAKYQVEIAAQESADAVAHGATGKGNDQVRLELSYMALNPRLKVIAPWREWEFDGREDLLRYAKKMNVLVAQSARNLYTRDENLWHIVHEGGPLEDIDRGEPDERMFQFTKSPEDAPGKPEYVEIDFVSGLPKRLNGASMSGAALIGELNTFGSRNGIGRMDLVENRLIGMKSHEVDEVPGGTILRAAHMALEEITLDRETYHFKQQVSLKMADLIYNGQWFTPLRDALQAFVAVTQRDVTGTVKLKLYKGNVMPVERKANYSLYREDVATFNRDDAYNHADAGGFIRLFGLPLRIKSQVDLNRAAFAPPMISASSGKRD